MSARARRGSLPRLCVSVHECARPCAERPHVRCLPSPPVLRPGQRSSEDGAGRSRSLGQCWVGGALATEPMCVGLRAKICTFLLERAGEEVFQASWARQSLSQLHKLSLFLKKAATGCAGCSRRGWVPARRGFTQMGPRLDLTPGLWLADPCSGGTSQAPSRPLRSGTTRRGGLPS